ncbi:jg1138 [Pararge aegeria aegeria]|uniref:Jg1138 protein n=1 Tax=Pararge aegeria aegeria TaxID=348720 RepID=A0A8S4QTD1_9NEOP|nr:jg1138 [Pararge aegeria aegeria]
MIPCAFTPHPNMVAQEPRRPPQRKKVPPRGLQVLAVSLEHDTPPVNTLNTFTTLDLSYRTVVLANILHATIHS